MKAIILVVYVDNIIVIGDDEDEISILKFFLRTEFEIKDLGLLKYFLGIEVARSKGGIVISRRKYILYLFGKKQGNFGKAIKHSNRTEPWSTVYTESGELLEDKRMY